MISLRESVRHRAGNRCEYCGIHQDDDPWSRFHVEHIVARQHGGLTQADNLALSCQHCNLHKGPNLSGIDPLTGQVVQLFLPRRQVWWEHFQLSGMLIVGTTPVGRATAQVLAMNAAARTVLPRGF